MRETRITHWGSFALVIVVCGIGWLTYWRGLDRWEPSDESKRQWEEELAWDGPEEALRQLREATAEVDRLEIKVISSEGGFVGNDNPIFRLNVTDENEIRKLTDLIELEPTMERHDRCLRQTQWRFYRGEDCLVVLGLDHDPHHEPYLDWYEGAWSGLARITPQCKTALVSWIHEQIAAEETLISSIVED